MAFGGILVPIGPKEVAFQAWVRVACGAMMADYLPSSAFFANGACWLWGKRSVSSR